MKNNKLFFASILIIVALMFACAFSVMAEPDETPTPTPTAESGETPSPTPDEATPTPTAESSETPSPTPDGQTPSPTPEGETPSPSPSATPDGTPDVSPSPTPISGVTQPPPEKTKDPYNNSGKVTNAPPTIPPDVQDEIEDIELATTAPQENIGQKKGMNSKSMLIILFAVLIALLILDIVAIYLRNGYVQSKKASFTRKAKDYYYFVDNEDTSPNEFDLPILEDEPQGEQQQIDIFDGFDFTENESDENG